MSRRPTTRDLLRDAQRASSGGKRAVAPCGHEGEHEIGSDGEAVNAPLLRKHPTCTQDHRQIGWISTIGFTDPRTGRLVISCAECGDILERR